MPRTKKTDTAPVTDEPPSPTPAPAFEPIPVSRKQIDLLADMFVANDLQRPDGPVRCVVSQNSEAFADWFTAPHDIVVTDINRNGDGGNLKPVKVTGYTLVKCGETEIGTRPFTSGDGYQHLAVTWEGGRYITMDEVVFVYDEALDIEAAQPTETLWRIHGLTLREEFPTDTKEGDFDEARYEPYHLFVVVSGDDVDAIQMVDNALDGGGCCGKHGTKHAEPATFDQIPESDLDFYRKLASTDPDAAPGSRMYARLIEMYDAWATADTEATDPIRPDVRKIVEGLALFGGAPELPLLKRCQREVEAMLDTEQILVLSAKASAINGEKVNKEREKKDYDKEIGDEIKALELQENAIMKTLRDNFTVDVIEVDERADYERGIVRIFRTGTNEQIATRALTHEERQTAMHFDEGPFTTINEEGQGVEDVATPVQPPPPCVYCDDQEGGCAECTKLPGDIDPAEQEGVAEMEAGIAREHDFEEAITAEDEALIGGEDERVGVGYPVRA